MKNVIILVALCSAGFCFAQSHIEWQHSFGGSAYDVAHSIHQTDDGGFIIAGITESTDGDVSGNHGWYDYWIVKLDSSGALEWQRAHGGTSGDYAYSIQQTADGGFVVSGYTASTDGEVSGNHGGMDYWIIKMDSSGDIEWQKCFGGTYNDYAYSIRQTYDGGYIIAGETNSIDGDVTGNHGGVDYWVVKIDSSGVLEWQNSLGGTGDEIAYDVCQTPDSGYILAGYSSSYDGDVSGHHGNGDYWIVKLDVSGVLEWQRSLGGSRAETAESIRPTSDGGYIVAGRSYSNDGDVTGHHGTDSSPDFWIVKIDSSGTIEWQNSFGGINDDYAYSVEEISDSGYIVAGYSTSSDGDVTVNHGELDYWIIRLNPSGSIIWQSSLGGSQSDFAHSVALVDDGGYIAAGWSRSNDGDVTGNHGYEDCWIVKLSSDTWIEELIAKPVNFTISAYPNPFNSACRISAPEGAGIEIFDINGRMVKTIPPAPLTKGVARARACQGRAGGSYYWRPDAALGSGVYLVRATVGPSTQTGCKQGSGTESITKRIVYLK